MSETLGDMYAAYFSARVAKGGVPFTYERWLESELTAATARAANLEARIAAALAIEPIEYRPEIGCDARGQWAARDEFHKLFTDSEGSAGK